MADPSRMGAAADSAAVKSLPAKPKEGGGAGGGGAAAGASAGSSSTGIEKAIKLGLAVLLLPACVGFAQGWYDYFFSLANRLKVGLVGWPEEIRWFAAGAGVFGGLAILLWRPVIVYVFAHEMVHALAAWMCLAKVSNFSATATGGQVSTSKTNTFIRLSPYVVPLYLLAALLGFWIASLYGWTMSAHRPAVAFVLGFTYCFHLGFTLWSLRRDQPDFQADGWLFSLVLIFLANLFVLSAVLGLALKGGYDGAWEALQGTAQLGWSHCLQLYHHLQAGLRETLHKL